MNRKVAAQKKSGVNPIGPELSFSGREAYKLLRTNIMFALPREAQGAKVIGVTSSVSGEGKSLTTINLAFSMAESGLKVLVIECDMRLPTLGGKMGIAPGPGLSNLLARFSSANDILHRNTLIKGLDVILAGDIPPNPSELLGAESMRIVLEKMGSYYDYIILDLPPVGSVTDALVISKFTNGMIVVVRKDYTNATVLSDTIRQLKHVDAHIVGFVFNDAASSQKAYKRYGK